MKPVQVIEFVRERSERASGPDTPRVRRRAC